MSHRQGSFREDWNELLMRFAHRGTPAALDDQLKKTKRKKRRKPSLDVHQKLLNGSQSHCNRVIVAAE